MYVCDVEFEDQIASVRDEISESYESIDGPVHSIAYAD